MMFFFSGTGWNLHNVEMVSEMQKPLKKNMQLFFFILYKTNDSSK